MHRFLVPLDRPVRPGEVVPLAESDARHALQVLRLGPGDPVTLLDGMGGEIAATLVEGGRREARARVDSVRHHPRPTPVRTLAAGLTKGKAWDLTLQKATELGVHRILPLACERSVAVVDDAGVPAKLDRWRGIVAEAAKQCGATWLPEILPPTSIPEWLERRDPAARLVLADLTDAPLSLHHALDGAQGLPEVVVIVGPEGDFSPGERVLLRESGVIPVGLGPLVLRAETAAAAMLAILGHELRRGASDA